MYLSAWLNLKKKIEKNMSITYVWLVTPIMIREKCIGQIYLVQMNKISLFFFHGSSMTLPSTITFTYFHCMMFCWSHSHCRELHFQYCKYH